MHQIQQASRQQTPQEYDYVAIRTTLDEAIKELRHWNDTETECDTMFQAMQQQQLDMMTQIQAIQGQHHNHVERTEFNMTDLIEQMTTLQVGVDDLS